MFIRTWTVRISHHLFYVSWIVGLKLSKSSIKFPSSHCIFRRVNVKQLRGLLFYTGTKAENTMKVVVKIKSGLEYEMYQTVSFGLVSEPISLQNNFDDFDLHFMDVLRWSFLPVCIYSLIFCNYQTSACEKVIRRDIARTYPEHEFFMEKDGLGQESLFNVMKVMSEDLIGCLT